MKQLAPSLHMLEIFMPAVTDENFFVQKILPDVAKIPFYTGIELPVIFKKENQKLVRRIVEDRDYQLTIWASPNINEKGDNLSALDPEELVYPGEVPLFEKYDEFVPPELVRKGFAYGILAIDEMKSRIRGWESRP